MTNEAHQACLPALDEALYAVLSERSGRYRLFGDGPVIHGLSLEDVSEPGEAMIEAYMLQLQFGRTVVAPMRRVAPDEILPEKSAATGGPVLTLYAPVLSDPEDGGKPRLVETTVYDATWGRAQAEWLEEMVSATPGATGCLMRIEVPVSLLE